MQSPSDSVIVKSNANGLVRGMFTRLDIGCGINKMSGWVGMDRIAADGVDVVHDFMDFPWPFEDNSVAEARAEHVIEHIPMLCMCCRNEKEPFFQFFDEVHRILRPNARFHIVAPHSDSIRAWGDPTHTRGINRLTLWYLKAEMRPRLGVDHYDISANFDASFEYIVNERGHVADIRATLTKLA